MRLTFKEKKEEEAESRLMLTLNSRCEFGEAETAKKSKQVL